MLRDNSRPDMRVRDLRHSCATLLLAQSVSPRVIDDRSVATSAAARRPEDTIQPEQAVPGVPLGDETFEEFRRRTIGNTFREIIGDEATLDLEGF